METLHFQSDKEVDFNKLFALYDNAGWSVYTSNPARLRQAIDNSRYILTVWSGVQLVGFLRAVGDGLTIMYIQDIIVLDSFRRQGIGKELVKQTLEKYKNVRQVLLLTDDKPETTAFYENVGFVQTQDLKLTSYIRINQ